MSGLFTCSSLRRYRVKANAEMEPTFLVKPSILAVLMGSQILMNHLLLGSVLIAVRALGTGPRLEVPEFEIDLDRAPELRFTEVIQYFNSSLWDFFESLTPHFLVNQAAELISRRRGPETEEFQREIAGVAQLTKIPEHSLHAVQMLYELNSVMVPVENITWPWDLEETLKLTMDTRITEQKRSSFPFHVGCTGVIAMCEDGTVYHARNLDFSFAEHLQILTYVGVFTKQGIEVFRAQTIAGYSAILTGMRKGSNGYTIEINTRYTDHEGGNKEMIKNVFSEKRDLSGWTKRKILETTEDYEDAVSAFSTTPYCATEYNIISGVKKGTILARNPDGLAYQLPLDKSDTNYIIMTNFDYIYHDIKEHFDPSTVSGYGKSRRKAAAAILDAHTGHVTPDLLFSILNDDNVMATDTIFQAIMNVETGLWNASLPACVSCGRNTGALV